MERKIIAQMPSQFLLVGRHYGDFLQEEAMASLQVFHLIACRLPQVNVAHQNATLGFIISMTSSMLMGIYACVDASLSFIIQDIQICSNKNLTKSSQSSRSQMVLPEPHRHNT